MTALSSKKLARVAIIGGGPTGLMAAEKLIASGVQVDLFDSMPSVGRKFLLAGKGGLNLTHSDPLPLFASRYGARHQLLAAMLTRFGPHELQTWAQGLGVNTFIGSSGRVFPVDMKAAPLLRAWLHRLRTSGVRFHMRHRWLGWFEPRSAEQEVDDAALHSLRFAGPQGESVFNADAVLLALGGGSWARLGSDGAWAALLAQRGVKVATLQPSNCGFDVARPQGDSSLLPGWSEFFRSRFAGQPLKTVGLSVVGSTAPAAQGIESDEVAQPTFGFSQRGEFIITDGGVEGSLIYAASALVRDTIQTQGCAVVNIDLLPARTAQFVLNEVLRPRGARSLSTHLKSRLGLDGVKSALLYELLPREVIADARRLAAAIKALPLTLAAARPIDEAISTAGGVCFEALDEGLMLNALPGVFCAGEMLDWEAPTGGYLLTACFASGVTAAEGLLARLL
jgi:uncharacterized flavoprotein (TIGR03862 family)